MFSTTIGSLWRETLPSWHNQEVSRWEPCYHSLPGTIGGSVNTKEHCWNHLRWWLRCIGWPGNSGRSLRKRCDRYVHKRRIWDIKTGTKDEDHHCCVEKKVVLYVEVQWFMTENLTAKRYPAMEWLLLY